MLLHSECVKLSAYLSGCCGRSVPSRGEGGREGWSEEEQRGERGECNLRE